MIKIRINKFIAFNGLAMAPFRGAMDGFGRRSGKAGKAAPGAAQKSV
jgi:hypothetical protein